jgi:hypothetical protein
MCLLFFFFLVRSLRTSLAYFLKKSPVFGRKKSEETNEEETRKEGLHAEEEKIVTIEPHTQTTRCRPLRFSETVSYLRLIFVAFVFATREKDDRSRRDVHTPSPPTGDLRARGLEGLLGPAAK